MGNVQWQTVMHRLQIMQFSLKFSNYQGQPVNSGKGKLLSGFSFLSLQLVRR